MSDVEMSTSNSDILAQNVKKVFQEEVVNLHFFQLMNNYGSDCLTESSELEITNELLSFQSNQTLNLTYSQYLNDTHREIISQTNEDIIKYVFDLCCGDDLTMLYVLNDIFKQLKLDDLWMDFKNSIDLSSRQKFMESLLSYFEC